jgi:hypothetical protein
MPRDRRCSAVIHVLPVSGTYLHLGCYSCFHRARRNAKGQLEPDASEKDVQDSLGFGGYEKAPESRDGSSAHKTT